MPNESVEARFPQERDLSEIYFSMNNECGVECHSARLDTFSPPTLESGITDGKYVQLHTISSLDSAGPFEFKIPGDSKT